MDEVLQIEAEQSGADNARQQEVNAMSPTYGKLKPIDYAQASMTFALKDGSISGVQSPETAELISAERFSEFINHLYDAASLPEAWVPCRR
jgi:hypothetical protein